MNVRSKSLQEGIMEISVVIVNYNVKHFLEQCLHSVYKSLEQLDGEVFVVDNNSVDGSCQMVKQKFPEVCLIENKDNVGFSKANNQAIKLCKGKYILLLNPDTFLQEDTLAKCVDFCNAHPNAGGLGVKMIDGKGEFLPESKRSLPTPEVSFYKIFGLSSLFPKSKLFGKYHLGYLDKDSNHKVEILAGAFMMLRKSVLDEVGVLDEAFFMYGEDIDLSYRIIKAGYDNYYFSDTTIIHYKGESTKKGSINYVMVFYKAMIIFANKHFSSKNAWVYKLLINFAIYFRAAIGILRRLISSGIKPVLDFVVIYSGFYFLVPFWEKYRFGEVGYYPKEYYYFVVPVIISSWMFFLFLFGAYERKVRPSYIYRGLLSGLLSILLIYALLPESLRFSRALILIGSLWALIATFVVRAGVSLLFKDSHSLEFGKKEKKIAIVGSGSEAKRVVGILKDSGVNYSYIGRVWKDSKDASEVLGEINRIEEIIRINKIDELVFCSQDLSASDIISNMLSPAVATTSIKIAPPESISIIGSNSINTAGDLYVVDVNALSKGMNKRKKRMFDILSGIILMLFCPVLLLVIPKPMVYLRNCLMVIVGRYTWVGITLDKHLNVHSKDFRQGILRPSDGLKRKTLNQAVQQRMDIMYAKDYKVYNDFVILLKNIRLLGRSV